jgi:hypothetical protein
MEIQGKRADRNLEGVRACILEAIWKAQGKGCDPGFIGLAIGGDRASGYDFAKKQLLRTVEDSNSDPVLDDLEALIMKAHGELMNSLAQGQVFLWHGMLIHRGDAIRNPRNLRLINTFQRFDEKSRLPETHKLQKATI